MDLKDGGYWLDSNWSECRPVVGHLNTILNISIIGYVSSQVNNLNFKHEFLYPNVTGLFVTYCSCVIYG